MESKKGNVVWAENALRSDEVEAEVLTAARQDALLSTRNESGSDPRFSG